METGTWSGDIELRCSQATNEYEALKLHSEEKVIRWEWASRGLHDPRFFIRERFKGKPGRLLKKEPKRKAGRYEYGFDSKNRIVVARHHGWDKLWGEEFFAYNPDFTGVVKYSDYPEGVKTLSEVVRYRVIADLLSQYHSCLPLRGNIYSHTREFYEYEQARLIRIRVSGRQTDVLNDWYELFTYTEYGKLERIMMYFNDGKTEITYQRPKKKQTLKALTDQVRHGLAQVILEQLGKTRIQEEVYCIILDYADAQQYFPPHVYLGLEPERNQFLKSRRQPIVLIWLPMGISHRDYTEIHIDDAGLLEACKMLTQHIFMTENWKGAKRLLAEIATDLMQTDWTGKLNVTSDFIVYSTDVEENVFERISASVPETQLQILRDKGLFE